MIQAWHSESTLKSPAVKNKDIVLSGDGRCDSPRKSTNTALLQLWKLLLRLHAETVDKRDVTLQSPNLEKEGFARSLQFLLPKLSCKEIVTDSLSAIRNELGEYTSVVCIYPDIYNSCKTPRHLSFFGHLEQVKENEKSIDSSNISGCSEHKTH